jgi:predicted Zn finger-like uncharacterized protein
MIATCTSCQARYRVPDEKVGPRGARIRCHKCKAFFLVPAPPAGGGAPGPFPPLGDAGDPAAHGTPNPQDAASPFTPLPGFFRKPRGPAPAEPDPFASPAPAPGDDPFAVGLVVPPPDDPFAAAPAGPAPDDPFAAASAAGGNLGGAFGRPARTNGAAAGAADLLDGPASATAAGVLDPFAAPAAGAVQDPFGAPAPPGTEDPFAFQAPGGAADPFAPADGGAPELGGLPGRLADPVGEGRGGVGPGLGLRLPLTDLSDLVGPPGKAPAVDVLPQVEPATAAPAAPAGPELTLEEMTPTGGGRDIAASPPALDEPSGLDLALPELDRSALVSPPPTSPPPLPNAAEPSGLELAEQAPVRGRRPEPPAGPPPIPAPARARAAAPRGEPRVELLPGSPVPVGPPRSRLQVVAMNSLSLAALLVVTFGLLAIWRGDGDLLARRSGRTSAAAVAAETSSGLYDTEAGPRVLFVRGVVRSQSPVALGPVTVRAEILRGGQVVAVGQAPAGAVPTSEEMAALGSPGAPERLRAALDARAPGRLEPGTTLPFLVTFTEVPPDLVDLEVRVVAVAEPDGQRG